MNYYGVTTRAFFFALAAVLGTGGLTSPVHARPAPAEKGAPAARAEQIAPPMNTEETYNLTFHNDSNYLPMTVIRNGDWCMQKGGVGPESLTVPPDESRSFEVEDSNNVFGGCTNAEKKISWILKKGNDSDGGSVSLHHYDCPKGTGTSGLCVIGEALKGWRTQIETRNAPVNSATCDGRNCLNTAVNDNARVPDIAITAMSAYRARPLAISTPSAASYPASYTFAPAGTAEPGADISLTLTGCPSGRSSDCSIPAVRANADGNWSVPSRSLMASANYTLTVSQTINGHDGPGNPQTRAFSVYDSAVNAKIISPLNLSWLAPGSGISVQGTVTPKTDSSKIRCYMDGRDTGISSSEVYGSGSWQCVYPAPAPGAHTFSGRVEPEHSEDKDASYIYMTAAPLAVTSPADTAMLYPPLQFSGTQQPGSVVSYTSDHCGSGQAVSTGSAWTAQPLRGSGKCIFTFTQRWQGMTSPEVRRTVFLKQKPVLTSASVVEQDTHYPLAGTGEPGATLDVSLDDGWLPIDRVTVGADGNWVSKPGPVSGSGDYTLSLKQSLAGLPDVTSEIALAVEDNTITPAGTGAKK